jgi:hypothetical protein
MERLFPFLSGKKMMDRNIENVKYTTQYLYLFILNKHQNN